MPLTLADFDYALPPELIAQMPLPQRSASRLLVVHGAALRDDRVANLKAWLRPGDLLVMNDSRVLHARLLGRKATGGQVEVLVERLLDETDVLAQVRASKPLRTGGRLWLENALEVTVVGRCGEFYQLRFDGNAGDAAALIERYGRLPLPPYIARAADMPDETRYQTVYARALGSVAAPTAGLHFDQALLDALQAAGIAMAHVTLHVGAGTFQPVRVEDLAQHRMHTEVFHVPAETAAAIAATQARGGRVVAVGTTSLRALESAAQQKVDAGETALFITPGFQFKVVDVLLTNFHLPKSTLLMLVSAFGGLQTLRDAYAHAICERYRFFSYGDAMLLQRSALP